MKDRNGWQEMGSEWERLKNSSWRDQDICPKFNPTRLSSNCQGNARQLMTSSPSERIEKSRCKAEATEKQSTRVRHNTNVEAMIYQSAECFFEKDL